MRVFSGIQPSGVLHIGNYFGAIRQWLELQKENECFFCIVDEHAITVFQKPKELKENILKTASFYLASGIDPKKTTIFVQSDVPCHAELCWILNTITKIGELKRMTQFKEKRKEVKEEVNAGLFDYPVLMAADILLYKTDLVPVGKDQRQHIELAKTLARRFNKIFGKTFKVPGALIRKESAKIMGLDNPLKKMSKSAKSPLNYIALDDPPSAIRMKIKKAVTDSGREIKKSPKKPAISNLLNIYSLTQSQDIEKIEEKYKGKGYQEFKEDLAKILIEIFLPLQERQKEILKDKKSLQRILQEGAKRARKIASETMKEVRKRVGLGINCKL